MKKRIIGLLLVAMMLFSLMPTAFAASKEANAAADKLHLLGLFKGSGSDANGKPNYALDRAPTRNEAVTMLVRLLGKEAEALAGNWEIPYTDVADWAKPYVGYAYANGLTNGTSKTTYSGDDMITVSQYLTFVLRALGYSSKTDFKWDAAWELADKIGLTSGEYDENTKDFIRGDLTIISENALSVKQKDSDKTLADKLMSEGAFTAEEYKKANEPPVVLKEPTDKPDEVVILFEVEGEMLLWDWNYRTEAGSYTVTPYLNGQMFDEYEVEVDWGTGSVTKNGDGTFTVNFPAKESLSIALYYNIQKHENIDENGKTTVSYSRTKRSMSFDIPIPDSGFALDRKGGTLLPGTTFGNNAVPYYVLDVYYNGKRIEDYTVTTSGKSITASVQADGSLLLMKNGGGKSQFTISYQGKTATFGAFG